MIWIDIDMPLGCIYEGKNGKTEYCPLCNHNDVPFCQYLEDDEAAIGIDERPVYCPIVELPSADVQPVRHGQWIIKDNPGTGWYRVTCSECGEDVTSVAPVIGFFPNAKVIWDFCPECGTRMDGD